MNKYITNDCSWDEFDDPYKTCVDSIEAINRRLDSMTPQQFRAAVTQMKTGLAPDDYNHLCDRIASHNFQG